MYYIKKKKKPLFDRTKPVGDIGETKKKQKSKQTLIKKLDKIFSLYIRLRDSRKYQYKYFRCISCGKVKEFAQADAGHYMSRKHLATRFNELNVHSECRMCNRFISDHLVGYRRNLVAMYGEQKVSMIEYLARQPFKLNTFEIEQMITFFSAIVKRMEAEKNATVH